MAVDSGHQPITETSLSAYFRERLLEYARHFRPPPHEDTCWYLGNLLERFGRSDQLFSYEEGCMNLRSVGSIFPHQTLAHKWKVRISSDAE